MKEIRRLQFLNFFVLIISIFLFRLSDYGLDRWFYVALLIGGFILLFFDKNHKTLIVVNALILFVGLVPLLAFFWNTELLYHQVYFVFRYALFAIVMFLLWYVVYHMHENAVELEELREKKELFMQLQADNEFCTWEQFEMRKQLILKGTRRRKEMAIFLEVILLVKEIDPTFHALVRTTEEAISTTVRSHYDVIYKRSDGQYLLLLQNMHEQSLRRVEERLVERMDQTLLHASKYIQFKSYEAKENEE